MKLKDNAYYDLVAPTSMGVRLTPENGQPVHTSYLFQMQSTSAESNVLNISASLGRRVKVLTRFVKESPISNFIQADLRRRNIEFEAKYVSQDGPWGVRHQFNVADSGYGIRGPRVYNDRAGEVGRYIEDTDFDLDKLFDKDGVKILHLSGLIAALSETTSKACLNLARRAKQAGTVVSFDLNFRASFWKNREKELRDIFTQIAECSDILIGNEEDFQLCLGVKGPEAGGKNISSKMQNFSEMILGIQKQFPQTKLFATTMREVVSANLHKWGAICLEGDNLYKIEPREIGVLDRIGGGDGFVGGLLYGLIKGWETEKCVQFGWASGALVVTMQTDYASPVNEEQVFSAYEGNARVKR